MGLPAPKPLGRFSKNFARLITSWTPPYMQVLGSISSKGVGLRMHKIVTFRRFFSFSKGSCASLQVGPLDRSSLLMAQMMRRCGVYVLFMVSLIKKLFFNTFHPKMWKIALHPTGNLKSYKFGIVEDMYKLFAPNRCVFGGGQFNGVI